MGKIEGGEEEGWGGGVFSVRTSFGDVAVCHKSMHTVSNSEIMG